MSAFVDVLGDVDEPVAPAEPDTTGVPEAGEVVDDDAAPAEEFADEEEPEEDVPEPDEPEPGVSAPATP